MTEQEIIEEMARDICERYGNDGTCYQDDKPCDLRCEHMTEAQFLYERGYRKERQGKWVSPAGHPRKKVCSNCRYPQPYKKTETGYHLLDNVKYCPNCGCKMIYKGER